MLLGMALLAAAGLARPRPAGAADPLRILVLGDSIAAEYGIARGSGWVSELADRAGEGVDFINASISGETTAGGRTRLPGLLGEHRPDVVIIELGGNDALRGLQLDASEGNLDAMVEAAKQAGARVLVLGMQVPPNYGRRYTERFAGIFATVAERHDAALVPFLLEKVSDGLAYFQDDRIHPNESAQPLIADTVWPALAPLLEEAGAIDGKPAAGARDRDRTGKAG
ncbi:MAG: arylesterase [Burkholderiaceae bacterium]